MSLLYYHQITFSYAYIILLPNYIWLCRWKLLVEVISLDSFYCLSNIISLSRDANRIFLCSSAFSLYKHQISTIPYLMVILEGKGVTMHKNFNVTLKNSTEHLFMICKKKQLHEHYNTCLL